MSLSPERQIAIKKSLIRPVKCHSPDKKPET
jgi:hypothetical protein